MSAKPIITSQSISVDHPALAAVTNETDDIRALIAEAGADLHA
jgi:hypothetical protein